MLLETGDGAGLLQRVARLVLLQGEPIANRRQLVAGMASLPTPAQLGDLLLRATMLFAVVCGHVGQLSSWRNGWPNCSVHPRHCSCALAGAPPLLCSPPPSSCCCCCNRLLMLPVVRSCPAQLALQLPEGTQLVFTQGGQLLQPVGIPRPRNPG